MCMATMQAQHYGATREDHKALNTQWHRIYFPADSDDDNRGAYVQSEMIANRKSGWILESGGTDVLFCEMPDFELDDGARNIS